MTSKDWKIVRRGKISITYKNKKTGNFIEVITFLKLKSSEILIYGKSIAGVKSRRFKTKTKALAYAKAYMRTH